MAALALPTIHFRLRFAVALALTVSILIALGGREAAAQEPPVTEYIVQMAPAATPADGRELVAELGGQVTAPSSP